MMPNGHLEKYKKLKKQLEEAQASLVELEELARTEKELAQHEEIDGINSFMNEENIFSPHSIKRLGIDSWHEVHDVIEKMSSAVKNVVSRGGKK
jgi:hypothetical protein